MPGASRYADVSLPFKPWTGDPLAAYDAIMDRAALPTAERERFDWERTYTRDEWLDQVPTFAGHSQLPNLDVILRRLAEVTPDRFTMPYATGAHPPPARELIERTPSRRPAAERSATLPDRSDGFDADRCPC